MSAPTPQGEGGITVTGSGPTTPTRDYSHALIEIKDQWVYPWQPAPPELVCLNVQTHVGSTGEQHAEFERRYGQSVREPGDSVYVVRAPLDLAGKWVRVSIQESGSQSPQVLFVGRFEVRTERVFGTREVNVGGQLLYYPQGIELHTATGPERFLDKIETYEAWHLDGAGSGDAHLLHWIPPFNVRAADGTVSGNRSATQLIPTAQTPTTDYNQSYVFGGSDVWTAFDMLTYLLERVVNGTNRPRWTLGGQVSILQQFRDHIETGHVVNARQLIDRIIGTAFGIDYLIVPIDDVLPEKAGFELRVFSVLDQPAAFFVYGQGTTTIPANSRRIRWEVGAVNDAPEDKHDLQECVIETSDAAKYDSIVMIGERVVSCFSVGNGSSGTRANWSSASEAAFKTAAGSSATPEENSSFRAQPRFEQVFAGITFDPASFLFDGGKALRIIDMAGHPVIPTGAAVKFQSHTRETLSRLPLRNGVDYSGLVVVDSNPAFATPEYLAPFAYVLDPDSVPPIWMPVHLLASIEKPSASVSILDHEWGLHLRAHPQYALARSQWSGANADADDFDPNLDGVDWRKIILTIAVETDYRLRLGQDLPIAEQTQMRLAKVLHVPRANFWFLAEGAVVGASGATLLRNPSNDRPLQNDVADLAKQIPGATARFLRSRIRGTLRYRNVEAYNILGSIIEPHVYPGAPSGAAGLVSSIVYDFEHMKTTIQFGHALGG